MCVPNTAYANDYDSYMPCYRNGESGRFWFDKNGVLNNYGIEGKIFICPSDTIKYDLWSYIIISYCYNKFCGNYAPTGDYGYPEYQGYRPRKIGRSADIPSPSRNPLVIDGIVSYKNAAFGVCKGDDTGDNDIPDYCDCRHSGGINILYFDGHVGWVNPYGDSPTYDEWLLR